MIVLVPMFPAELLLLLRKQTLLPDGLRKVEGKVKVRFEVTIEVMFEVTREINFEVTIEVNFEVTIKVNFEVYNRGQI